MESLGVKESLPGTEAMYIRVRAKEINLNENTTSEGS